MSRTLVLVALSVAAFGTVFAVGGLSSLQAGTPAEVQSQAKPYNYAWFLGVLELFTLILGFWAVFKDYRRLHGPVLAFFVIATSAILPLIADTIYNTAKLPGGNGDPLRGNIAVAGLVIAVTGNFLVILATAAFNLSGPADQPQLNGGYGGSGGSKAIDGGSGV